MGWGEAPLVHSGIDNKSKSNNNGNGNTKNQVQVNNTSVMNSIENASITVKSPSGRTVILYKKHLGRKATEEMKDVFWKCANNPIEALS